MDKKRVAKLASKIQTKAQNRLHETHDRNYQMIAYWAMIILREATGYYD